MELVTHPNLKWVEISDIQNRYLTRIWTADRKTLDRKRKQPPKVTKNLMALFYVLTKDYHLFTQLMTIQPINTPGASAKGKKKSFNFMVERAYFQNDILTKTVGCFHLRSQGLTVMRSRYTSNIYFEHQTKFKQWNLK